MHAINLGFSPGFPGAKAQESPRLFYYAEAQPPHKCGGSHRKGRVVPQKTRDSNCFSLPAVSLWASPTRAAHTVAPHYVPALIHNNGCLIGLLRIISSTLGSGGSFFHVPMYSRFENAIPANSKSG